MQPAFIESWFWLAGNNTFFSSTWWDLRNS
jgi:hypothetical protein